MISNLNLSLAVAALAYVKAQGLRAVKADKAAVTFIMGAHAAVMAQHGEESSEAAAVGGLALMTSTRGTAYLSGIVAKDAAARASAENGTSTGNGDGTSTGSGADTSTGSGDGTSTGSGADTSTGTRPPRRAAA